MKSTFARAAVMGLFLAAAGCGGDGSSGNAQVIVPNVVGDTQAAATSAITGAGLALGTVTAQSSSTVTSGSVISQNPAASTSVAGGSDVSLVVSSGPALVAVPNVVGDTKATATTAITGAGLAVGAVTQQASSTVASGDVISENPAAGASVTAASSVALVISTGAAAAQYTIGGTVIGLSASATVRILNGTDSLAIAANGSFSLPTAVATGGTYSVSVGTPTSAQTCGVQNATGTIASAKVTNVVVYCTHNVSNATLKNAYTAVLAGFDTPANGTAAVIDGIGTAVYNGAGSVDTTATFNVGGLINPGAQSSSTYAVATTNAIPTLTGSSGAIGGIEGVDGDAIVSLGMASGIPPGFYIGVLPDATAKTDSVNGTYTQVVITAELGTGDIKASEGTTTLTNGTITGTLTSNTSGAITTGNRVSGQFTIASGLVTLPGDGAGAVSADRDLSIFADTNSGDNPNIGALVPQGSGVTQTTFAGIYSVSEYGGESLTTTVARAITLSAYGDGTFLMVFTKNANGTITTDNDSGTYTAAANGTLTLTDSEGNVYNGGISPDGNALVLANVASKETPAIWVGVRQ
jgi:beta-lactam-binding protein with PASTA domain